MDGKRPNPGVDEDIEILPEVVSGLDPISAVTIDERGKMGRHDVVLVKDIGAFFKITDPKIMGMIPGPSFSHFGLDDAKLDAGGACMFKVSVQGGAWDGGSVHLVEERIDGSRAPVRLLFFEFNGLLYDFGAGTSGFSLIGAFFSRQIVKSSFLITVQFATQAGERGFPDGSVRVSNLLFRRLFEKRVRCLRWDLPVNDRAQ